MPIEIAEEWVRKIDDSITFCGVLEAHYDEIAKNWNEDTRDQYNTIYNSIILPNLRNHNEKGIKEYTKEDFEEAYGEIEKKGKGKPGQPFIPYAIDTLERFRHLICTVVEVAVKYGFCEDVLWGTAFSLTENYSYKDGVREHVRLKKSLTISQEHDVANALLRDPSEPGEYMGLLLMYSLGLRNGEACGANYGDIKPMQSHPECKVLWVYKSTITGTNQLQSSGKSRNADRIIPVPEVVGKFLDERRRIITKKIADSEDDVIKNVDEYPIVCVGNDYRRRCSASQLSLACRKLFRDIGLDARQLAYIERELSESNEVEIIKEKEPTAYLFRRNYGTHLYLLGLSEAEIEYVIGHDIDEAFETRNEFINGQRLYQIKKKLDQRPILNEAYKKHVPHIICEEPNTTYPICNRVAKTYQVPLESGPVKLTISSKEPREKIGLECKMRPRNMKLAVTLMTHDEHQKENRTVDILEKYHVEYAKTSL